jgi:hypothetical protein
MVLEMMMAKPPKFIDVPSGAILDSVGPNIKKGIEAADTDIIVRKIEWTAEGLRVWLTPRNSENSCSQKQEYLIDIGTLANPVEKT